MHYFQLNIGDFCTETAPLTAEEVGIYLRLLMLYYGQEGPLRADLDELAFKTMSRTRAEMKALSHVLRRCFTLDTENNTYVQKRCENVIAEYHAQSVQSRFACLCRHWDKVNRGIEKPKFADFAKDPDSYFELDTGHVRKVTGRNSPAFQLDSSTPAEVPLSQSKPITNNQEPETNDTPIVPKGTPPEEILAEAIYALYPKKVGKGAAIKAIVKVLNSGEVTELELQAAVRCYASAVSRWPEQEKTFVPYPATWMNQKRYMDDPAMWNRNDSSASRPGFGPQKKEVGAAVDLVPQGSGISGPPEGWEDAMAALWGQDWREVYADWNLMPPADHRQVRQWLQKKERGTAKS